MPAGVMSSGAGRAIGVHEVANRSCGTQALSANIGGSAIAIRAIDKRPILRFSPTPTVDFRAASLACFVGSATGNAEDQAARRRRALLRQARPGAGPVSRAGAGRRRPLLGSQRG